jgi:hypothetical protein
MTERKITENASGAETEREGNVESPKQVDVAKDRPSTRCFAVVVNKIDGGGRTRQRHRDLSAYCRHRTATQYNSDNVLL